MALAASTNAAGFAKRSRKPYTYERLSDLRLSSSPVSVMGVAVLFKAPYQSRGRDFTCTVEIVDEGCSNSPVPLIFFNKEKEKLPRGVNVGDVVCVRRVEVGEFNHRLQGKCRNHSSWLVWGSSQRGGGREGRGKAPTLTSEGASWDSLEMTRAGKLLSWSTSVGTDSQLPGPSNQPASVPLSPLRGGSSVLPLSDITIVDHKINILSVVKTVSLPQKSRGPDYFISVVLIDETNSSDGFPLTLFAPEENELPQVGDPGSVVYLTNVKITEYEGSILGCGHQRSRVVCFTSQSDSGEMVAKGGDDADVPNNVRQRAQFLLEWVATAQPALVTVEPSQLPPESQTTTSVAPAANPSSSIQVDPAANTSSSVQVDSGPVFEPPTFLTVMFHPTWPLCTLRDVLDSSAVPLGFRLRVKVLQVAQPLDQCCQLRCPQCKHHYPPSQEEENQGSNGECERCSEGEPVNLRYMYTLSLLVGDLSGVTSLVHLTDTDASDFFRNLPPADLNEDSTTRESLLKILRSLCGGEDPFSTSSDPQRLLSDKSRPWIDCCVQTYPSWKGAQLRIIDTWYIRQ